MTTTTSILIGSGIGVLATAGLFLNGLVIVIIIKGNFLRANGNSIYSVIFNLLLSDTLHLSLLLFYLVPAAIVQGVIIDGLDSFLGFVMLWSLCVSWANMDCLAFSRLAHVVYPQFSGLFNRRRMVAYCILIWPICGALAATAQYLLPCCQLVLYYKTYSLHFGGANNTINFADYLVEKPVSVGTTLTAIICYSTIIVNIRNNRRKVAGTLSQVNEEKRKKKEYSWTLQFIAISFCSTLTWISFVIYPRVIPLDQPEWFVFVAIGMIINCSISSVIYLSYNAEFKDQLRKWKGARVTELPTDITHHNTRGSTRLVTNGPKL